MKLDISDSCELCGRERETSSHHLIPQQVHSKNWCKKMFTKEEMNNRRAELCGDCHPFLHKKFTHRELGERLNTVELLLANDEVSKYVTWVRKQSKKAKKSK